MPHLIRLLSDSDIARVKELIAAASFVDGRETAGAGAVRIKNVEQMRRRGLESNAITSLITARLENNTEFQRLAMPAAIAPLRIYRATPGMGYGWHTDEAFIDGVRTDLAFTVFLTDEHGGGELVVGDNHYRGAPGEMLLYPCGEVHQVTPATSGIRMAIAGWVQSQVRGAAERGAIAALSLASSGILRRLGATEEYWTIEQVKGQLLRQWSD